MRRTGGALVSTPVAGPTVVRRQLGRRLWRLREGMSASVEEVVGNRHLGISRAKLYKLEAGKHPAKPQDIAALCRHYGATPEETETLTGLSLATQGDSWWHVYGEGVVPEWFSLYLDVEPAAATIRRYEAELIPGLLQTREYALEVYRARNPDVDTAELERRVAVRMARQAILDRTDPVPPQLHVVLNESVMLRKVGGRKVMAAQIDHLHEMTKRSEITVQVLPLKAGAHAAMEGAFTILDFPNPEDDPSVIVIDTPSSAAYLQKRVDLERYTTIFKHIDEQSIPLSKHSA